MAGCDPINLIFNLFLIALSVFHYTTGGQYVYTRNQIPQHLNKLEFQKITLVSQAAMYFSAGAVATICSVYLLLASTCRLRSLTHVTVQFFIALVAFCMNMGIGVRSAIDLILFEQNYNFLKLQNIQSLQNLQYWLQTETILVLGVSVPVLIFLLYDKWSVMREVSALEERGVIRLERRVKMSQSMGNKSG